MINSSTKEITLKIRFQEWALYCTQMEIVIKVCGKKVFSSDMVSIYEIIN